MESGERQRQTKRRKVDNRGVKSGSGTKGTGQQARVGQKKTQKSESENGGAGTGGAVAGWARAKGGEHVDHFRFFGPNFLCVGGSWKASYLLLHVQKSSEHFTTLPCHTITGGSTHTSRDSRVELGDFPFH